MLKVGYEEKAFEDVNVGDEITLTKDPITRTQIVQYAGSSGDFNPMHHDERMAVGQYGDESVFAHGMMSQGFVAQMLTNEFGIGTIRKLHSRFTWQVRPGDTLTFKAKITKKYSEKGENFVELETEGQNQFCHNTLRGMATLALPSKK